MHWLRKKIEAYLGHCVKRTLERDKPFVVAVAGSVGKSSTREAIGMALRSRFADRDLRIAQKNFNNELGVPLVVFGHEMPGKNPFSWLTLIWSAHLHGYGCRKLDVKYLVLELAADHPGDLDYLLGFVKPHVAVMTALGPEHTEFFGSVEAAIDEERKVLKALPEDGEAVLNADDALVKESSASTKAECVYFGRSPGSSVTIFSSCSVYDPFCPEDAGTEIHLGVLSNHEYTLRLRGVYGLSHAYAIAAALAFCVSMDIMSAPAVEYLKEHYRGMPGRSRLIPGIKNSMLLDDTYNAQPQAMQLAIRELKEFPIPTPGRRIAVLGDMLELGPLASAEHEKIGKIVAESNIDLLVCCGKLARIIGESAILAGMPENCVAYYETSAEAGIYLQSQLRPGGDVLLVKGSQSSRMEKIVKELMAEPLKAPELLVRQSAYWLNR